MPVLQVGGTEIPYELRRSDGASERRITVTPGQIEVVALADDNDDDIAGFLSRKRQWLFNTVREMETIAARRHAVPRFMSGSKIPYRGRKMRLTVRRSDAERALVTYRNGFIVDLPHWVGEDSDALVVSELRHWLKQRVRRDVREIADLYGKRYGLEPKSLRVADMRNGWGSCGREGNILINWTLVFAPRRVLEYVVAHELAHLRHRSHGEAFWAYLEMMLPKHDELRRWLATHESSIDDGFLLCAAQ